MNVHTVFSIYRHHQYGYLMLGSTRTAVRASHDAAAMVPTVTMRKYVRELFNIALAHGPHQWLWFARKMVLGDSA